VSFFITLLSCSGISLLGFGGTFFFGSDFFRVRGGIEFLLDGMFRIGGGVIVVEVIVP
jgi:hypothetical protein